MASAGTVTVDFAAETAKFVAELKKVNSRLQGLEGSFQSLTRVAKAAASVFSVGAITAFVKVSADAADQLGKTADRLRESTERLKTFQIASQDAGVSVEAGNKLLQESQKRLGEAATGTGDAAKFIKLLGLNVSELRSLSPVELFTTYSDAINGLANRSEQLAAASALMGKGAAEAFNLIRAGSPAIEEAAAFVERFGLALSRVDIRQIEQANDSLTRIQQVSSVAGQRIAAGLAPAVEFFAGKILEATGNTKDLQAATEQFSAIAITAFEVIANGARSLQAAFFGLAAGGARVLQFLTFGDVSEAFAASVDANLAKANDALSKIKSIEEIQQTVVQALEDSRLKAEQSVAEQAARDAASKAGGLTLGDDIGLTLEQQFEITNEAAKAAAEAQKQIQRDVTKFTEDELERRAEAERNMRQFVIDEEFRTQQMLTTFRQQGALAAQSLLTAYGGRFKKVAQAILAVEKALAIRSAFINTREAVTKVLAKYPPPFGYALAAGVAALGAAQIAAIASSNSGSSSPAIGAPHNPVFTEQSAASDQPLGATAQSVTQIIFAGPVFNNRETRQAIVDAIKEEVDNEVIVISPTSRNGQELLGATT